MYTETEDNIVKMKMSKYVDVFGLAVQDTYSQDTHTNQIIYLWCFQVKQEYQ